MSEIVVALDHAEAEAALRLVDRLDERGSFYKVGLQLFSAGGPAVVRELRDRGKRVFLDLKLHDIPNTVAGAVRSAAALGVDVLTVHAAGGEAMLRAAAEAAGEGPRVLAVTVLTSMAAADVEAAWGRELRSLRDEVLRLSDLAARCGVHGVVSSVHEVPILRRKLGAELLIATPGIRLPGTSAHDQSRVATPGDAVRAGADYLVVGRTVTAAPDPAAALEAVRDAVDEALTGAETA